MSGFKPDSVYISQVYIVLGKPAQVEVKQKPVPSKTAHLRDQSKDRKILFTEALYNTYDCTVARFYEIFCNLGI